MKKLFLALTLIVAFSGAGATLAWAAQNSSTEKPVAAKPAHEDADAQEEPSHAYRLDFTVSELEDGKKINTRQYSINTNAPDKHEIKIGSRVPVEAKQGELQYMDVGTSIWCQLRDHKDEAWLANDVLLNVRSEISNFALPDQQEQTLHPILRQMKIEASTIALVGKPIVVGTMDDPNSKRQFQLEVTVTRLR
jgi:hypothetical protein